MNFADYLRHTRDATQATVRGYVRDVAAFVTWFEQTTGERATPEVVTPTDVREYRAWLQRRGLKAATINRRLHALRAWLEWARGEGVIQANPAAGVKIIAETDRAPRWLDKRERYALQRAAERILQTARMHYPQRWVVYERDALLVLFLLNTGLRAGEVVRLTVDDLTLTARKGYVLVQGKGRKQRMVPLNAEARKVVRRWLEVRESISITTPTLWSTEGALTTRTVQRAVERVAKEAQLENVTPHVLRHTFAKSLVDAGTGLEKVAKLLGHSSLDTTRRYVEPGRQDLERAVENIVG